MEHSLDTPPHLTPAARDQARTGKRRRLSAAERGSQLLDVAVELFAERGIEGVSLEDIARVAGVTRPTVYAHHGSLAGIFVACARRARAEFERDLLHSAQIATGTPEEALATAGRVFLELIAHDPARWALLFATSASWTGEMAEQLLELRQSTIDLIADLIAPRAPHTERATLLAAAHIVSGIGEQLGRWWIRHPDKSLDDALDLYVASTSGAIRAILQAPDETS
ncbi:TetR/AcrR family transcriptional regulator [Nocardia sp. NPDC046763]|uniref:TetR/AcrR family transcriptional regulator n=1 Tax=Nocardia sp. NPDC046763 TaxID=3155256 RepID=UPI0033EF251F